MLFYLIDLYTFFLPVVGLQLPQSVLFKGLGTVRILYSRISVVFHNEFSSNGRAGLILLLPLSLLLDKKKFVLRDLVGRLSSSQALGEHFLSPDSRLQLSSQRGYTGSQVSIVLLTDPV